jgi:NitT/TauT family transport system substrate-binding protein
MKYINNQFSKLLGRGLFALLATVAVTFAANGAYAKEKVKIVTSSTGVLYATAYIAKQAGYFDEEGLDVTVADGGGGSNAVAAVVGGSADVGMVGIRNLSQAIGRGVPMKVVGTGVNGFPATLVARSALAKKAGLVDDASIVDRMKALKGGTIAVTDIGGASGGFVRYLIKQAGLPKDHVTMINLNSNTGQLASLKAGKIDGFVNTSPTCETAIAEGYGMDMVLPSRDLPNVKDMHFIILGVREDYLTENREIVRKLLRGIRRAQLLVLNDSEKAKNAFFGYLESLSSTKKIPTATKNLVWKLNKASLPGTLTLSPDGLTAARKFFKIDATITDDMLVDNTIAAKLDADVQ